MISFAHTLIIIFLIEKKNQSFNHTESLPIASNEVKSLFFDDFEEKKALLNKTLFKTVVLKKIRKKFDVDSLDSFSRKNLQKKPTFLHATQGLMGRTAGVFENLKSQQQNFLSSQNLHMISKEALEMKYFENIKKEIETSSGNENLIALMKTENKKKEIENSLAHIKKELQISKKYIKDLKEKEKIIRHNLSKSDLNMSNLNEQVKLLFNNSKFFLEKIAS